MARARSQILEFRDSDAYPCIEGEDEMKNGKLPLTAVLFFLVLYSTITCAWAQTGPKPGTKAPVITRAYAAEKGRYGDALKIYLEADDPGKDMVRIAVAVDQVGYGHYPADWTYLKAEDRDHFIGYLQWNTFSSHGGGLREWTQITIKVSIFDKAGNESNVVVLPFEFVSEVISNPSLAPPFNQANLRKLGNVDINLFEPTRDGDRHERSEPR